MLNFIENFLFKIGNGSTNGDHYELGNYNTDGSNLSTFILKVKKKKLNLKHNIL